MAAAAQRGQHAIGVELYTQRQNRHEQRRGPTQLSEGHSERKRETASKAGLLESP